MCSTKFAGHEIENCVCLYLDKYSFFLSDGGCGNIPYQYRSCSPCFEQVTINLQWRESNDKFDGLGCRVPFTAQHRHQSSGYGIFNYCPAGKKWMPPCFLILLQIISIVAKTTTSSPPEIFVHTL